MFDGKTYEPSDGSHPVERRRVSAGVFPYRVKAQA